MCQSFSNVILNAFEYSANLNELRIQGVFLKHYISDIYFKPSDTDAFVEGLMEALQRIVHGKSL